MRWVGSCVDGFGGRGGGGDAGACCGLAASGEMKQMTMAYEMMATSNAIVNRDRL
jgi:hypothetical protein